MTTRYDFDRINEEEPQYTCPLIDHVISQLDDIEIAVRGHRTDHLDEDELRSLFGDVCSDVEWTSSDAVGRMEPIRKNAEALRAWGDEMRAMADELLDEIETLRELDEQLNTWGGVVRFVWTMARHQLQLKIRAATQPVRQAPNYMPV